MILSSLTCFKLDRVFLSFNPIQASSPVNKITFNCKETDLFLSNHSYKPSIIRQMIMLPLHGQSTAAVKNPSLGRSDSLFKTLQGAMFLINRQNKCLPSSFLQFNSKEVLEVLLLSLVKHLYSS